MREQTHLDNFCEPQHSVDPIHVFAQPEALLSKDQTWVHYLVKLHFLRVPQSVVKSFLV
jgi:hypothetical protein